MFFGLTGQKVHEQICFGVPRGLQVDLFLFGNGLVLMGTFVHDHGGWKVGSFRDDHSIPIVCDDVSVMVVALLLFCRHLTFIKIGCENDKIVCPPTGYVARATKRGVSGEC